jgi:hypothetical protein
MNTSDVDAVAEAICNAHCGDLDAWEITYDSGRDQWRHIAQAAIDTLRPTITTVEQLDALPDGTILRDADGQAWQKRVSRWTPNEPWMCAGSELEYQSAEIELPALVSWRPESG